MPEVNLKNNILIDWVVATPKLEFNLATYDNESRSRLLKINSITDALDKKLLIGSWKSESGFVACDPKDRSRSLMNNAIYDS